MTHTELETALKKQTDEIVGVMHGFMGQVDERLNEIEKDVSEIKSTLNNLTNTIDAFVKRLDDIETEQIARDRQFARLLAWAHKVSEKTGIPLDNL